MDGFNTKPQDNQNQFGAADLTAMPAGYGDYTGGSKGSSVSDSDLTAALNQAVQAPVPSSTTASQPSALDASSSLQPAAASTAPVTTSTTTTTVVDDHNHGDPGTGGHPNLHTSLDAVDVKTDLTQAVLSKATGRASFGKLARIAFSRGDFLDPGAGDNTVIGSGGSDIIVGKGGGFNTITTGTGRDTVVLGEETTNRIFDFDPTKDTLAIDSSIPLEDIVIAQGKNTGKGGLNQPLDRVDSTLIIDKREGHILADLTFTKAESLTDKNFVQIRSNLLDTIGKFGRFANVQQADDSGQQLNGTLKRDKLLGGEGNDFLFVGDDGFKFGTAKGSGPQEFPFPNPSPGTSELTPSLKNGVLTITGSYKDFDAAPLFSQNETSIDPKATILNGSDPVSLINGFLKVPKDVEGNPISGTHLHFSPSEDSRGNFADATVVRYLTNTAVDAKSGTISGQFHLTPDEQAALLAGNLYVNIHSNIDVDGDGKAGFPTGENRLNFNQNIVQFTGR
jgi:hypothetical protein